MRKKEPIPDRFWVMWERSDDGSVFPNAEAWTKAEAKSQNRQGFSGEQVEYVRVCKRVVKHGTS